MIGTQFWQGRISICFAATIMCFTLSACGGGRNIDAERERDIPAHQKVTGRAVYVVEGISSLSFAQGVLGGSGAVLFAEDLGQQAKSQSFEVKFQLQDGGSLELVTFSNALLEKGLTAKFSRKGSGPGSLKLEILADGKNQQLLPATTNPLAATLLGVDASQELAFTIEIHNNEKPAHILIWEAPYDVVQKSHPSPLFELGAENSEGHDHGHDHEGHDHGSHEEESTQLLASPGVGLGKAWGLRLNQAIVSSATLQAPVREKH